ncbi:MAG: hypothetical protein ACHQNT_07725 [Bacteroidia bacterium]
MKKNLLLIFALPIVISSCKSSQSSADKPVAVSNNTTGIASDAIIIGNGEAEAVAPQDGQNKTYRLVISFISIGEGTDRNARQIFDAALSDWEKNKMKEGSKLNYETVPWGREGEVDFCFSLTELDQSEQKLFINDVRERFKGHELVQFTENEPCRHKR